MAKMTKAEKRDLMNYIRIASNAHEATLTSMVNLTKKLVNDESKRKDWTLQDSKFLFEKVRENLDSFKFQVREHYARAFMKETGIPRLRKGRVKK